MDFKLSEEQELIRSNVREFALKYIEPRGQGNRSKQSPSCRSI